jgi:hypothetical protein
MQRSDLHPAIRRHIRHLERKHGRKCYAISEHTNHNNERHLFGRFGKVSDDPTVITVAYGTSAAVGGWFPATP